MLKKINILREEIQYFEVEASNMQLDNEDTQLSNCNSILNSWVKLFTLLFVFIVLNARKARCYDTKLD